MSAGLNASGPPDGASPSKKLSTFDMTNLVVGSIIGADIYVATAISSRLVGPFSLLLWVVAGVMALIIALSFSFCVMAVPRAGGPYAYVTEITSPFGGFMVGWSLLLAEWFSLAVFPVAFAQYFAALIPGIGEGGQVLLKGLFIATVMVTNIIGTKSTGRANDALTLVKLSPLILIILGGLLFLVTDTTAVVDNMTPFLTGAGQEVGQALVLIFWAYAGFELSTLPADDVERPERTIPRAIVAGMVIVIAFYLLTNLAVVASLDQATLQGSPSPLMDATRALFPGAEVLVLLVGVGALLSILGADESGTLGTSRLAYAMALDGLLPHQLAKKHPRFDTPYVAILALGGSAFLVSLVGGLAALISSAVLLLSFVYLLTCVAGLVLLRRNPQVRSRVKGAVAVPVTGAAICIVLMMLVQPITWAIGLTLMAVGIPVYMFFSPRKELKDLRERFYSREYQTAIRRRQSRRFLALLVHLAHHLYQRARRW